MRREMRKISYVQVLAAKHDVNNIEAASVLSFLWIALCYGGEKSQQQVLQGCLKRGEMYSHSQDCEKSEPLCGF